MRSDWHRYNLKRKVAELPPVSSDDYNEKVLDAQAAARATAAGAAYSKFCETCQKNYFSENAYRNHIGSQKHKLRLAALDKNSLMDGPSVPITAPAAPTVADLEVDAKFENVVNALDQTSISPKDPFSRRPSGPHHSGAEQRDEHPLSPEHMDPCNPDPGDSTAPPPLSRCLFCNYDSPTWRLSVAHMTKIHDLFIPEQNYLTDMEGLLAYLQAKVTRNHECLFCHKLKTTTSGVQTHMRDTGHCRIAFETEEEMLEVGQFYDFSSTYSDAEVEDSDADMDDEKPTTNGGVRLPDQNAQLDKLEYDEGWETDSSFSSLDSDELTSIPNDDHSSQYQRLPLHRHHSHTDPRPHKSIDGYHSHAHHHGAVFYDDHEMYLPSGRVAGHRSLKKYYRQNLHSYPSVAEKMERNQRLLDEHANEDDTNDDAEAVESAEGRESRTTPSQALTTRREEGMIGATTAQKRDVRLKEIRGRQQMQRHQNRYQAKLEKQHNQQKHFRVSLAEENEVASLTKTRILSFSKS